MQLCIDETSISKATLMYPLCLISEV